MLFQDILVFTVSIVIISIAWSIVWNWKLKHILFVKKLFNIKTDLANDNSVSNDNVDKVITNDDSNRTEDNLNRCVSK